MPDQGTSAFMFHFGHEKTGGRKDERETYGFRAEPFHRVPDGGRGEHTEDILGAEVPAAGHGMYPGG